MAAKINYVAELTLLAKVIGAFVAICGGFWFFGEPFLEDYVESHFEKHEQQVKKERSTRVRWRTLIATKIGCDEDEAHIKVGKVVREEEENLKKIWEVIDSDYNYNKSQRNKIIGEIHYISPNSLLNKE